MTTFEHEIKALRAKYKRKKSATPPEELLWEIETDNPAGVWQLAQLSGISSWTTEGGVVLSGIDQVEAIRFLRQHNLMQPEELNEILGGSVSGHKSLDLGHGLDDDHGSEGRSCPISANCERDDRHCSPAELKWKRLRDREQALYTRID